MKRDDSDRVNDYFGDVVRDWTPLALRRTARMLYAPVSSDREILRICSTVLSAGELERANTFLTERDKNNFIQRRAFRRFCGAAALGSAFARLSEIAFDETEEGRPYISSAPGLWFSFSSCRLGFLGAWSFDHAVGVDIEDRSQDLEMRELAKEFFSEAEAKIVDATGMAAFFQLWTLKESALKSIGKGLPFGLDAFGFEVSPHPRVTSAPRGFGGPGRFEPYIIESIGTCAALVTHF